MEKNKIFDVIIVGGSYSGLSAALALGRSRRNVLIIDSGKPCNASTPHSHNFLTQDGKTPAEISQLAKSQVLKYKTVDFQNDLALSGKRTDGGFEIKTNNGKTHIGKKLIFATGVKDIMPDIKGLSACWGISVIHCPYCHGYEFVNKKTAIMINGDHGYHLAQLVNNLTDNLTVLTSGKADFSEEELKKLAKHKIEVVETEIEEIQHKQGYVEKVVFKDGHSRSFNAIYAGLPFKQHTNIPMDLGCELSEEGYIQVDTFQKTNVAGVYACGDSTSRLRSIATSVYTGNFAGAALNMELCSESF
ncbi:NAD(P)/FAD-dependent oxidoreductase [Membranihabitans marinus]|uniref:NAD(P)/FAD-dependent oxidoreductase n=1 Tax=Membranihabitans marinus TaxID=1227546 RepID=UPI00374D1C82